jgi:hypothetical protein
MDITRIPNQDALDLTREWDEGYLQDDLDPSIVAGLGNLCLVISGTTSSGKLNGLCYIWVNETFNQPMSKGQKDLLRVLIDYQAGAVYVITSVNLLKRAMGLKNPLSIIQRLENLQSIGAIEGFR